MPDKIDSYLCGSAIIRKGQQLELTDAGAERFGPPNAIAESERWGRKNDDRIIIFKTERFEIWKLSMGELTLFQLRVYYCHYNKAREEIHREFITTNTLLHSERFGSTGLSAAEFDIMAEKVREQHKL